MITNPVLIVDECAAITNTTIVRVAFEVDNLPKLNWIKANLRKTTIKCSGGFVRFIPKNIIFFNF